MKTRLLLLISLLLAILLSACSTMQATPEYMPEGPERDAVVADADVFIQNIITGIETKDYATLSQDFNDDMLAAMKPADFDKLTGLYSPLGKATSVELLNVQVAGEYFAVRYKVTYPEKVLTFRVVVDQNDPRQVGGLWSE